MHASPPDPFWLAVAVLVIGFFLVPLALSVYDRRRERRHPQLPRPSHTDERNY